MQKLTLGCQVTDKITGFKGTVTGLVFYLTGCNQALVAPRVTEPSKLPEGQWIDVGRLDVGDEPPITLETGESPGACEAPPVR